MRGRIPKELKIQASFVKGSSAEWEKNPMNPQKKVNVLDLDVFQWRYLPTSLQNHWFPLPKLPLTQPKPPPNHSSDFCVSRRAEPRAERQAQGDTGGTGHKGDARGTWGGPGGPKDADPSLPEPGRGEGSSNWQPGLCCPFGGIVFNCTGCRFRGRAARGPYLCFHHFSFWEMKLKIPSQQLQRKKN